jgi:hypothetical protein
MLVDSQGAVLPRKNNPDTLIDEVIEGKESYEFEGFCMWR